MTTSNGSKTSWQSPQIKVIKSDYLQFVISANESLFYAEVPTVFIYKEPCQDVLLPLEAVIDCGLEVLSFALTKAHSLTTSIGQN
jgi:hypothetical protein